MPTRLCIHPRCPNPATYRGRCPTHTRTADRERGQAARLGKAEQRKVYNSKRWKVTRNRVLFENPLCTVCGRVAQEVDHIAPLVEGGDPYDLTNLQGLCRDCHFEKTARENMMRRIRVKPIPKMLGLLILVGPRGVGKSTLRAELARNLDCPSASPDDFDDGWHGVTRMLWRTNHAIVECCRVPILLLGSIGPTTCVVQLEAPSALLADRLAQRPDIDDEDIPRLLIEATDTRPSFYADITPDHVLMTDQDPALLAQQVRQAVPWRG